jgi:hypothetical protein
MSYLFKSLDAARRRKRYAARDAARISLLKPGVSGAT